MRDTSDRTELRRHVVAAVIVFLKRRIAETGGSHWGMAPDVEAAFPGIPNDVVWQGIMALDEESSEAWWESLSKTIEGEIIKNALTGPDTHQPANGGRIDADTPH